MGCTESSENSTDGEEVPKMEYASTCSIPTDFVKLPLLRKEPYNHNATMFTFATPEGKPLALPTCGCVLLRGGKGADGAPAVRPYTPCVQTTDGEFQMLVKVYPDGIVSQALSELPIGGEMEFKHIKFNVKLPYPFGKKTISMISGGTGITPMYQALQKLLTTPGDTTEVTLLYGNATVDDILLKVELDAMAAASSGRLKIVYVVGTTQNQAPIDGWEGERGWIDSEKVEKHCYKPSADTSVFICGLPGLYASMCGPRGEKELAAGSILPTLGYTQDMVTKF